MTHDYTSTACQHELCGSCRKTCKFCAARCGHGCHQDTAAPNLVSPADTARQVARELLAAARGDLPGGALPALELRIATDPGLFWLRDGETPPGQLAPPDRCV